MNRDSRELVFLLAAPVEMPPFTGTWRNEANVDNTIYKSTILDIITYKGLLQGDISSIYIQLNLNGTRKCFAILLYNR